MDKLDTLRSKLGNLSTRFENSDLSTVDLQELLHEIQAYKIELEMQNESLREAQIHLERTKQQFVRLFEQAPVGYVILDAHGFVVQVNATFARMVDSEAHLIVGKPFYLFLTPESKTLFLSRFLPVFEQPEGKRLEVVLHGQNRVVPVQLEATHDIEAVDRSTRDDVRYLFVTVADLSERVRSENALRESRERLDLALDAVQDGVWEYYPRAGEMFLSPRCYFLLGFEPTDFPPTMGAIRPLVHADDLPTVHRKINESIAQRTSFEVEVRMRRKDGRWAWILFRGRAVSYDDQQLATRLIGTCVDISARKQEEEHLRRVLVQAEAATRTKNEFLATMSHEIRTPLNGIMGMLQILQLTELTPEQIQYVDIAQNSSTNLLRLLSDILDMARIDAGMAKIEREEFVLEDILQSVRQAFCAEAESKKLEFTVSGAKELPPVVVGDPGRIRQVLLNLVGNALKFTDTGSIQIRADRLACRQAGRARILFTVVDTGIGIDDVAMQTIFESFTQGDGSYTRRHGGVGLGLAIVRKLVRMLDASLCFESEVGCGTCFYFSISVQVNAALRVRPEQTAALVSGSLHVLVVEDEQVNAMVVCTYLQDMGHTWRCVDSGEAALQALDEEHFDCVLMDIHMPGMDGVAATKAIRNASKAYAAVPVIALTAHAMPGDREKFLALGMDSYVSKPFTMAELEQALRALRRG